jgi:hypothetical protein
MHRPESALVAAKLGAWKLHTRKPEIVDGQSSNVLKLRHNGQFLGI